MTIASYPFNRESADVIMRTSDDVDFYLSKEILSIASPFFATMFSLPQASPKNIPDSPTANGFQALRTERISLTENSTTIDTLLRYCYPVTDPKIMELPLVEAVLEAAIKYEVDVVTDIMRSTLSGFAADKPLQVFVIACHTRCEREAELAADAWRKLRRSGSQDSSDSTFAGSSYIPEMKTISTVCYLRLLKYMQHGGGPSYPFYLTQRGQRSWLGIVDSSRASKELDKSSVSFRDDLCAFAELGDADAIVRSNDGVNFRIHKLILRLVHGQGLFNSPDPTYTDMAKGELPVYNVEASGDVLAGLLRLCYPAATVGLHDFTLLRRIVRVATNYEMMTIVQMIKERSMDIVEEYPLDVYFLAVQFGWSDEAQRAAKVASNLLLEEQYVLEMENTSAEAYYDLLKYQHEYITAISEVVSRHAPGAKRWKTINSRFELEKTRVLPPTISTPLIEVMFGVDKLDNGLERNEALEEEIQKVHSEINLKLSSNSDALVGA